REDLYYRLAVVPLTVPPLRERLDDLPSLVEHFLAKHAPRIGRRPAGFDEGAMAALQRHPWPGNVRELENVVQQAMVFCEGERVQVEDLPAALRAAPAALPVPTGDRPLPDILEDLERQLVAGAYQRARGVKAEAARLLGLKPSALYYKLDKYGIGPPGEGGPPEGS
ncbi:MAG TPA: helix-turn-helix domain-containing protein, partial [Anaeromyxobacteraceae bacterium]